MTACTTDDITTMHPAQPFIRSGHCAAPPQPVARSLPSLNTGSRHETTDLLNATPTVMTCPSIRQEPSHGNR